MIHSPEMPTLDATLDLLRLFGDPTRVRLAALVERHELTVAELTSVTGLAQPRVSTHLAKLREAGVVRDRPRGASTLYAFNDGAMPADVRAVWELLSREVEDDVLASDRTRCEALVKARARAAGWPDALAGRMERHYSPGRTWESLARGLLGLVHLGDVLDAGCGDGTIAELVAPRAATVTCLDLNEKMLQAARARLRGARHVRFAAGDVHALPFEAASFDHVLSFHVLCDVADPAKALAEAGRVLRAGGALTVVTLAAHRHLDVTAPYGHRHAGFRAAQLRRWLQRAGLAVERCAVATRERREPHFQVLTAFARRTRRARKGSPTP
jgi:ubiquinone/menaquinone biosynthesis C-methylase UbiE/DNA-binding transcriptional ArsR family regulator